VSIGPYLAKSTFGQGSRLKPALSGVLGVDVAAAGALVKLATSPGRIRPRRPLPLTWRKSMPRSRASLRTDGPPYRMSNAASGTLRAANAEGMSNAASGALGAASAGVGAAAGSAAAGDGAGGGAGRACAATASVTSVRMTAPSLTRSPSLTFKSATTPPSGDGTSIEALSDSNVTSGCSG